MNDDDKKTKKFFKNIFFIIIGIIIIAVIYSSIKDGFNFVGDYLEKRKECKEWADRADTVYRGKQRYKSCMEE